MDKFVNVMKTKSAMDDLRKIYNACPWRFKYLLKFPFIENQLYAGEFRNIEIQCRDSVRMCTARSLVCENDLPHVSQACDLSPECVRMCLARLPGVENAFPYVSQTCGRSPECDRMCRARLPARANALSHAK